MSWPPHQGSGIPTTISGSPGIGNLLTVIPPAGYFFSGVQFYRNGIAIPGEAGETNPYVQVAADVVPGTIITAEITGLMLVSQPFKASQ
jgi:hypothetical protein